MPRLTLTLGLILIVLGLIGYFATGMASITALIPAFFGLVLGLLGILAARETRRKLMMHIAVVIALLGVAGTFGGLLKMPAYFRGETLARPEAVLVQAIMCLLCLIFVVMSVKSFVDARRARTT